MDPELVRNLVSVGLGALVSLVSTLSVEGFKGRRERVLEATRVEREDTKAVEDAERARQEQGRTHAATLFALLNDLWNLTALLPKPERNDPAVEARVREVRRLVYDTYLLLPSPELRNAVHHGMYGTGNVNWLDEFRGRRDDAEEESNEILVTMRSLIASYLRGDRLDVTDCTYLDNVKAHVDEQLAVHLPRR